MKVWDEEFLDSFGIYNQLHWKRFVCCFLLLFTSLLFSSSASAQTLISISNPPAAINTTTAGATQFWLNAGTVDGTPVSLRATVDSISGSIRLFTSGDNPVVRTNTGGTMATITWEITNRATGAPILADPNFLITDIDGSGGTPNESVSAACAGLTSYTINGDFVAGCNANSNPGLCQTNIRVTESGGNILAEGTQNQNGGQQEGYMQYSWTDVSSWVVNYMSVTGGRWFVHDADGDVPFDGTEIDVQLVDMATIKGVTPTSLTSPAQGEQITFQIDLSNAGPEPATGANLTDLLPAGLSYDSHTTTSGTYNPVTGLWSGVNVAVNGLETLTITATVTAPAGTMITNVTTTALAAESVCSSRDLLEYPFIVAETPAPSLSIIKSVDPVTSFDGAGDTITYSYEVTNTGNVNIDSVVPTDSGPTFGGQAAINSLVGFSPASATITPGQTQVFTATYLLDQADVDNMAVDADPLTSIENTASATGAPTGGMLAAVTPSSVETGFAPMPSLSVVKAVNGATSFSQAGDVITYQYTVTNTGNIAIEDVSPTDSGPTFNGVAAAGMLSGFAPALVDLAPTTNQVFTATYTLQQADIDNMVAAADPLTAIDNTASATGDPIGATALPAVPDSTVETGFAPAPSMTIAKSVSSLTSFSQEGDTITYEYVLLNTGNVTISNAVPTDTGPTFNGVAGTNALSAFSPNSVTLLPAGPPVTVTATYVLSQQDIDNMFAAANPSTAIDNTASATGTPTGGTLPAVPNSTAETGFSVAASLTIVKSAGTPSIGLGSNSGATDAGDTIAYSFDVTNSGDVTVDTISINDSGPSFNSVAGTGSLSAISCPLTTLAPNQMTTCSATYTLSQADVDNAIIGGANAVVNSATAAGEDPANNAVTSPSDNATQTIAADSSIEIVKSAGAPTVANGADATLVDPGDTITYQLDVSNTGNTTLSNVQVSDTIATVSCPATTDLGNAFVNDGSSQLAVGDSIVCTAVYALQQPDLDSGGVQNTADVASTDPTGATTNDSDTVNSGFTQKTSVALVKSATALPMPPTDGDPITYTFELTNTGNVTLTSPEISDPICEMPPGPLTFTNGYTSGDAGVAGEMEAGETWEFECVYTIDQDDVDDGEVANTAIATGTPPPSSGLPAPMNTASNLANADQEASIALDKSSSLPTVAGGTLPAATDVGDTIDYSFEVENTGNVTLTNVIVTDPLITAAPNNGTISCPAGVALMAPMDVVTCTATYTVTQTDIDAGMVINTASVIGTPPPSVPQADSPMADSANMVTIAPMPNLELTKSVAPLVAPLVAGTNITYTFEVENTGNVSINNVVPVDAGPTFNGSAAINALSAFNPVSANLIPGDSQIFTATYTLDQEDIDNASAAADPLTAIDNSATATGTPENGSLPTIDPSTTETGAAPNPSVELTKSSVPPAALITEGDNITYTFLLNNNGNVTISNPVVNDARCSMPGTVLSFASGYVSGDTGTTAQALDVGETWTFSCTYPVSQADINAGTVANMATGGGQDPSGAAVEDDAQENTPLAQTSEFTVAKSTASAPSVAGDTLLYQFIVDNTGNVDITSVSVTDAKCAATPALVGGDIGGDLILTPSETWTYECTSIGVTQTEVDNGVVNNSVEVTGAVPPGAPVLAADSDTDSTVITPITGLTIAKTAAAPTTGLGNISSATDEGDTIVYSFTVSNPGNVTISSIVVNDPGPSFDGTLGAGSWSGVTCPLTTLLPMQSTTCTATYTLDQTDIDAAIAAGPDSVTNTAAAQGQDPSLGVVTSPSDDAMTSITSDPMVEIVKMGSAPTTALGGDPVLTDPGDTVAYTINVENTGNTSLSNVEVTDSITSVSCPATASPSGAAFTNAGDVTSVLAVGDMVVCTASYTIQQVDIDNGSVVNIATVSSTDPAGTPVNGVSEETTPFTQKTSVALDKTAAPLPTAPAPIAGDLITYTFELENTGNVSLSTPQIDDPQCEIPIGPLTASNGLVAITDINADGLLDAGETWTFECQYALTTTDLDSGGEITNTATGGGTPPADSGLDAPSGTSSAVVKAQLFSAITLDKVAGMPTVMNGTLPTASDVGDFVTFTFNIVNQSNVTFETVSLSDPLITNAPNNGTFSCVFAGTTTTFTLDLTPLPAAGAIQCTADYQLTQTDIDAGSVSNMALAAGDPPGTVPPPPQAMSGSMVPIAPLPSMTINKAASVIPPTVVAGDLITYSYTLENTGNVTIDNVAPIDLGPTINGVPGSNALSAYTPITASLAPGDIEIFTATYALSQQDLDLMAAAPDPSTAIDNQATADGEPSNGSIPPVPPSTVETGVAAAPALELVKDSTIPAMVSAGSLISYSFSLQNVGNVTISAPTISDAQCQTPGANLSFASGYVSGDTGVIAQSLDVGETWVFECQYALTQADIDTGTVQNTAQASGQDPGGNSVGDTSDSGKPADDSGGNSDPTNTPLPRAPAWIVNKSTTSTPTQEGDTLVYDFEVVNTGNVSISGIAVNDLKCAAAPTLISGDLDNNTILAPTEIFTYRCTSIAVTQDEVDAANVPNNVSVTGSPPAGTTAPLPPAVDNVNTPIVRDGALELVKSASSPTIGFGAIATSTDAGDQITYSFVVTNTGNVTIDNLSINDQGVQFNGVAGTNSIGTINCALSELIPNQSTTCTGIYTLSQSDVDNAIAGGANSVSNTATVQGDDPANTVITSPQDSASTDIVSMPAVEVLKTLSATTPNPTVVNGSDSAITDPGDELSYVLTVSNTGNAPLSAVTVNDSIAAVTCPATTVNGQPFTNVTGVLNVGDAIACTAVYALQQSDIDSGSVMNTADAAAQDAQGTSATDDDTLTTGLTRRTSVVLTKAGVPNFTGPLVGGQASPLIGDTVVYTFTLENTGNVSLSSPQVSDPLCGVAPLDLGNGFTGGDSNNDTLLGADETWSFTCTVTLVGADIDSGGVENTAVGTGTPPAGSGLMPPESTAGTQTVLDQRSGISLDKVASMPTVADGLLTTASDIGDVANPGDTITYSFTVENEGNVTLSDVTITDPQCANSPLGVSSVEFISGDTAPTNGLLEVGETWLFRCDYDLTQADIDTAEVMNTASVTGTPPATVPPAPPPTATSGAVVPVVPAPGLAVAKSAVLPANFVAGQSIIYSFVITNTGNVTIGNVLPVDAGPTFNGVAGQNSLGAFTPTTPSTSLPVSLAPQGAQTFTASYVLDQVDIDNMAAASTLANPTGAATAIDNSATATGTPASGNLPPVTPDMVETGIAPAPLLELTKRSIVPPNIAAGVFITYEFSLMNTGNTTISSPTINDAMCQTPASPLTFSSGYISGDSGLITQSLDVGETWVFNCQYALTQTDIDAGTVQNTATASGQTPGGIPVMDTSDSTNPNDSGDLGPNDPTNTLLAGAPLWDVVKSTTSVPTAAGDTLDYMFVITNTGNTSISGVMVNDAKCAIATPPVLTASTDLGADGILTPAGVGGVPAAESWTYTCTSIPVTQTEMDTGIVSNMVTIAGTSPNGTLANDTAIVNTTVTQTPALSLVKEAGATTLNADGSFDQVFDLALRNTGNVSVTAVSITDDLTAQFGTCFDSSVSLGTNALVDVAPASDSTGNSAGVFPVIATATQLGVGDTLTVVGFTARFNPNASGCTFPDPAANSASVNASSPTGPVTDTSDSGTDPDAGGSNDAGVPTPFTPPVPSPELGLAKSARLLAFNQDFSFDVEYTVLMQNTGDVNLSNLELFDNLVTQFGAAFVPSAANDSSGGVLSAPVVSAVTDAGAVDLQLPNVDTAFDGGAGNIFDGTSGNLGVGDVISVVFTVRANPALLPSLPVDFRNVANGGATAPDGSAISDQSNSGSDPSDGSGGGVDPTIVTLDDIADLPIVLGQFTSRAVDQTLLIEWQTQTEVGNLGFNLYGKFGDEWRRLNEDVIPGQGDSVEIVAYSFTASLGATALAISDVDARGQEELHGPFIIGKTYGAEAQRKTTDWSDAIKRSKTKAEARESKRRAEMLERSRARQRNSLERQRNSLERKQNSLELQENRSDQQSQLKTGS